MTSRAFLALALAIGPLISGCLHASARTIVDSPPLGAGVDPFVLGTLTKNVMLVLRAGETDREFALAKLRLFDRLPVEVLGAVLNDIRAEGAYRHYAYVYGYTADEISPVGELSSGTGATT